MAQYFYDLSLGKVGAAPYFLANAVGDFSASKYGPGLSNTGTRGFYLAPRTYVSSLRAMLGDADFSDAELLIKCGPTPNLGTINFYNIGPGIIFRADDLNSGYLCGVGSGDFYRTLRFYDVTNTSTNIGSSSTTYLSSKTNAQRSTTPLYIRVQFTGTTLRARAWWDGEAEPGTWGVEITNAANSTGKIGVSLYEHEDGRFYEFISIGTDGDPAPSALSRSVSGTVNLPNGSPAEGYIVRCYHRGTGVLIDEGLTNSLGAFGFTVALPTTEPVYCVAVDQLGNTYNAVVRDLISPV